MSLYERLFRVLLPETHAAPPSGTIVYEVVSDPAALNTPNTLPRELHMVLQRHPELDAALRAMFARGIAIGVRSAGSSSTQLLNAVRNISVHTQHRLISSWLRPLLLHDVDPVFTAVDRETASAEGLNLDAQIEALRAVRSNLKVFVLIDDRGRTPLAADEAMIAQINTTLVPAAIEYAVNRIEFDNANERTEVAQAILKAMLIIGPAAHLLEQIAKGVGKIVAASTDDVLSEVAELSALRGSGFSWRQLLGRSKILIPVFILATYGAYSVEYFIQRGEYIYAGLLFGFSAVALSMTTAVQSIQMYKQCVDEACADGKLNTAAGLARWRVAAMQDFANPARLGLLIGACISPVASMTIFVLFPELTHNGWLLALLGTTETVVAGSTVIFAKRINDRKYSHRILKA